ncbi:hypothetical protein VPHD479_0374 [Vibrio phage D479]
MQGSWTFYRLAIGISSNRTNRSTRKVLKNDGN